MVTNLGDDVFIDFEPNEFQFNGWAMFRQIGAPVRGLFAQTGILNMAPTFDINVDRTDIVVTRVQGRIRIDRGQTWVVTGRQTSDLLVHEQGHYYIAYVPYVLELKAIRALRIPLVQANIPRNANAHVRQTLMHNAVVRRIRPIHDQSATRTRQLHTQYDMASPPGTNHGRNASEQQQWNNRFAQSLLGGSAL